MRISGIRPHLVLEHPHLDPNTFWSLGERKPRVLCVKIKIVVELPCLLKF